MKIRYLFIVLIFCSCENSHHNKTPLKKAKVQSYSKQHKVLTDSIDAIIGLGDEASFDELPKLSFENIGKSEYLTYKQNAQINDIDTNPSHVVSTDSSFTLYTSKAKLAYKKHNKFMPSGDVSTVEYKGFINNLKAYFFNETNVGDDFEISQSFLIDSVNNIRYDFISRFDGATSTPAMSVNKKYFFYYENGIMTGSADTEENNSFIGVIKISENGQPCRELSSFTTTKWNIEDAFWVHNNTIALKLNQRKYVDHKWLNNYSYKIAALPRNR
jgi:hypothetical protein